MRMKSNDTDHVRTFMIASVAQLIDYLVQVVGIDGKKILVKHSHLNDKSMNNKELVPVEALNTSSNISNNTSHDEYFLYNHVVRKPREKQPLYATLVPPPQPFACVIKKQQQKQQQKQPHQQDNQPQPGSTNDNNEDQEKEAGKQQNFNSEPEYLESYYLNCFEKYGNKYFRRSKRSNKNKNATITSTIKLHEEDMITRLLPKTFEEYKIHQQHSNNNSNSKINTWAYQIALNTQVHANDCALLKALLENNIMSVYDEYPCFYYDKVKIVEDNQPQQDNQEQQQQETKLPKYKKMLKQYGTCSMLAYYLEHHSSETLIKLVAQKSHAAKVPFRHPLMKNPFELLSLNNHLSMQRGYESVVSVLVKLGYKCPLLNTSTIQLWDNNEVGETYRQYQELKNQAGFQDPFFSRDTKTTAMQYNVHSMVETLARVCAQELRSTAWYSKVFTSSTELKRWNEEAEVYVKRAGNKKQLW